MEYSQIKVASASTNGKSIILYACTDWCDAIKSMLTAIIAKCANDDAPLTPEELDMALQEGLGGLENVLFSVAQTVNEFQVPSLFVTAICPANMKVRDCFNGLFGNLR